MRTGPGLASFLKRPGWKQSTAGAGSADPASQTAMRSRSSGPNLRPACAGGNGSAVIRAGLRGAGLAD